MKKYLAKMFGLRRDEIRVSDEEGDGIPFPSNEMSPTIDLDLCVYFMLINCPTLVLN